MSTNHKSRLHIPNGRYDFQLGVRYTESDARTPKMSLRAESGALGKFQYDSQALFFTREAAHRTLAWLKRHVGKMPPDLLMEKLNLRARIWNPPLFQHVVDLGSTLSEKNSTHSSIVFTDPAAKRVSTAEGWGKFQVVPSANPHLSRAGNASSGSKNDHREKDADDVVQWTVADAERYQLKRMQRGTDQRNRKNSLRSRDP